MTGLMITAMFLVTGIIHLLPVMGVGSAERVSTLYGIAVEDPNPEILMRHRAILFGLLGAFLIWAGFNPVLQPAGFVAGFVSMLSFIGLSWSVGGYNAALRRVVIADVVVVVCLVFGAVLYLVQMASPVGA